MTENNAYALHGGDALELLDDSDTLPDESAHAIVTDPPYGLAFMGNDWDDFSPKEYQQWTEEWARKAKRVLKPGGHLLAFSGERTFHRLFSGVEDAGFTIRTSVMWLHGQGFPKGQDVGESIDRFGDGEGADAWGGFKSQLKPAFEPIVVARKPLSESAIYRNVLEHGTGAYNIDACRIPNDIDELKTTNRSSERNQSCYGHGEQSEIASASPDGRYPANVVVDEHAAAMLDAQSGELSSGTLDFDKHTDTGSKENCYGEYPNADERSGTFGGDSGGASRFYYTSKASTSERTHDGQVDNDHPTVKPLDLLEWLTRLVTAEGQTVLDPFAGSGTTGVACINENRRFVGIERDADYREIAHERLALTKGENAQQTLSDTATADGD